MPAKTNELIKKHKKNNKINHQSKNVKILKSIKSL